MHGKKKKKKKNSASSGKKKKENHSGKGLRNRLCDVSVELAGRVVEGGKGGGRELSQELRDGGHTHTHTDVTSQPHKQHSLVLQGTTNHFQGQDDSFQTPSLPSISAQLLANWRHWLS